jgi:FKBP-type peptidyl-prolyl cis-trans isomerase FkpA
MRRLFRALLCALPLLAAGCGDVSGPADPDLTTVSFAAGLNVDISTMTRVGDGVYVKDLEVGEDSLVAANKVINVRYQGWHTDGTRFDHNLAPRALYPLVLGQRRVIVGWEQGIPGMRVGGRRLLVIPPSLGYGNQSNGPTPPNSVLVFEVEVVSQS